MSDHSNKAVVALGRTFKAVPNTHGCRRCVAENDSSLCAALPSCLGVGFVEIKPGFVDPEKTAHKVDAAVDQHAPGAKLDIGKVRPSLILSGMARALNEVAKIGTFGASKYTDGGWVAVPNGFTRYTDAQDRHRLAFARGEERDRESLELHLAHEAWNALAKLDLYLREQERVKVGA